MGKVMDICSKRPSGGAAIMFPTFTPGKCPSRLQYIRLWAENLKSGITQVSKAYDIIFFNTFSMFLIKTALNAVAKAARSEMRIKSRGGMLFFESLVGVVARARSFSRVAFERG